MALEASSPVQGQASGAVTVQKLGAIKVTSAALQDALEPHMVAINLPELKDRNLLNAWIPSAKRKIAGGQLRGDTAILEVEGEIFEGALGLSLVKMVKVGAQGSSGSVPA